MYLVLREPVVKIVDVISASSPAQTLDECGEEELLEARSGAAEVLTSTRSARRCNLENGMILQINTYNCMLFKIKFLGYLFNFSISQIFERRNLELAPLFRLKTS